MTPFLAVTERLKIRSFSEDDRAEFRKLNGDPEVMAFFPKVMTDAESDAFLEKIREKETKFGYGFWALELRSDGRFIGFTGFNLAEFDSDFTPCLEIGWRIRSSEWNRGYATEAALGCLRHFQNDSRFKEIYSFTAKINTRSSRVMEKIGLSFLKEFDHPAVPENHILKRHVLYGNKALFEIDSW